MCDSSKCDLKSPSKPRSRARKATTPHKKLRQIKQSASTKPTVCIKNVRRENPSGKGGIRGLPLAPVRFKMSSAVERLLQVLQLPKVLPEMRDTLYALVRHCDNQEMFAECVLAECSTAIIKYREVPCSCNCGQNIIQKVIDIAQHEGEALNEVARRWIGDFLLIAIGKRKNHSRKLAWLSPWCSQTSCLPEELLSGLVDEWRHHVDLEKEVGQISSCCAVSGMEGPLVPVQLIPASQDRERHSRFCERAKVFFNGRYDSYLWKGNAMSSQNTLMMSAEWATMVDEGHITFYSLPGSPIVYAIPLTNLVQSKFRAMHHYDFAVGGLPLLWHRPEERIPMDQIMIRVHYMISKAWQDTGLGEKIIQDITYIDNMPSKHQEMHVLGLLGFKRVLHHKLAIF